MKTKILKLGIICLAAIIVIGTYAIANSPPDVTLINPNGDECDDGHGNPYPCSYHGDILINWTATDSDGDILGINITSLRFNFPNHEWGIVTPYTENDGQYEWDTTGHCGAYKIRIYAFDKVSGNMDWSDDWFNVTTGCGGNGPPSIEITYPRGGEILKGPINISWIATDPDGDPLKITLGYFKYADFEFKNRTIVIETENDGWHMWDTKWLCGKYMVYAIAYDGHPGHDRNASTEWFNITTGCKRIKNIDKPKKLNKSIIRPPIIPKPPFELSAKRAKPF